VKTPRLRPAARAAADFSRQRLFHEETFVCPTTGQVFWLPDPTTDCTFPRQALSSRTSVPPVKLRAVVIAAFVPGYSGGTATDSHRLPYSSPQHQAAGDTQVFARKKPHGPLRTASW
jgi:hypothetical protein